MSAPVAELIKASDQQCVVTSLYRIWIAYAAGTLILGFTRQWIFAGLWIVFIPLAKWAQIRFFLKYARWTKYGAVTDEAPSSITRAPVGVTFFHALGCPFCPIMLRRLQALQEEMGFTLQSVDVTFNPQLLVAEGIRSVPVVEVGGKRLIGNATSEQLASLIALADASTAVS